MIFPSELTALHRALEDIQERAIDLLTDRQPQQAAAVLLGALKQVQFTLARVEPACPGCEQQAPKTGSFNDPFGGRWHQTCWRMHLRRAGITRNTADRLGLSADELAGDPEVPA